MVKFFSIMWRAVVSFKKSNLCHVLPWMHVHLYKVRPIRDECYVTVAHVGQATNPFHALEQFARCQLPCLGERVVTTRHKICSYIFVLNAYSFRTHL